MASCYYLIIVYVYITCMYLHVYVVVEDLVDTAVCEGDDATFTCVAFIPSGGFIISPQWQRNGTAVDMMRHTITSNVTGGTTAPVYISSTITVSNVTVLDDDGALYQCGTGLDISLSVVGKYNFYGLMSP